eukprot:1323364-Amorphochlora_amoeboformis.AAC.1
MYPIVPGKRQRWLGDRKAGSTCNLAVRSGVVGTKGRIQGRAGTYKARRGVGLELGSVATLRRDVKVNSAAEINAITEKSLEALKANAPEV